MLTAALALAWLGAPPARAAAVSQLQSLFPETRLVLPRRHCLFNGRTGAPASLRELLERAERSDVVYAGESHDSAAHHRLQAQLLDRLPRLGAAFEMLYSDHQRALDAYLSGAASETEFLAAVDWERTWKFPFPLYRPVFERLRAGGRAGAAINLPRAIIHKVATAGLGALTPEERARVPADFEAVRDPAYLAMLQETFLAHGGEPGDAAGLARFVDAMSLWNEAMAAHLLRRPGGPVLVVAGAFHAYDAGMPASVARRRPEIVQTTVVLLDRPDCPERLPPDRFGLTADFIWAAAP